MRIFCSFEEFEPWGIPGDNAGLDLDAIPEEPAQQRRQLPHSGQTAHTGVENADGSIVHDYDYLSRRLYPKRQRHSTLFLALRENSYYHII